MLRSLALLQQQGRRRGKRLRPRHQPLMQVSSTITSDDDDVNLVSTSLSHPNQPPATAVGTTWNDVRRRQSPLFGSSVRSYSTLLASRGRHGSTIGNLLGISVGSSSSTGPPRTCHHHRCQIQQQLCQRRYKSIFVSKHNKSMQLTSNKIIEYCERVGIIRRTADYKLTNTEIILRECPFCSKDHKNLLSNLYKLYIHNTNGCYHCHRCGNQGSWFDFKRQTSSTFRKNTTSVDPYDGNDGDADGEYDDNTTTRTSSLRQQPSPGGAMSSSRTSSMRRQAQQPPSSRGGKTPPLPQPSPELQRTYVSNLDVADRSSHEQKYGPCRKYLLETRGLHMRTLRKYGIGLAEYKFPNENGQWMNTPCITFPWFLSVSKIEEQESLRGARYDWQPPPPASEEEATITEEDDEDDNDDEVDVDDEVDDDDIPRKQQEEKTLAEIKEETSLVRRIKVRALENKGWQRMDPAGGGWGLFGYHTIPVHAKEVVITEGEYDAMAVWQETGRPTISLPNGCRSLPVEVLPLLEKFEKIYLWMDSDAAGQEGADQFSKKIGLERTYIVRPTPQNCILNKKSSSSDNSTSTAENLANNDEEMPSSKDDLPSKDAKEVPRKAVVPKSASSADSVKTTPPNVALPKDANEALLRGYNLERIIEDAKLTPHDQITDFASLREEVLHEIMHPDQYVGHPITSLPGLTKVIKGLRRGELTVLTGPTGSGKTTFLGQVSLDLAEQDVNVLWGSFEIKNTRLIRKLMHQFSREPLPETDHRKLHALADRFEQLPFKFMKFHGGSDVDDVLDAMAYAHYVYDCEHFILDNMQFMVSLKSLGRSSTFDKFDVQDVAIEKFRQFATDKNVHVTLVVHPRKEQEFANLSISSIYGSAKATQEADTVLILQNDGRRKFVDVKKNRFNGQLGHSPLFFERQSNRYFEQPQIGSDHPQPPPPAMGTTAAGQQQRPQATRQKAVVDPWAARFDT